ncbi:MAG: Panacea domain-containing protein [Candidatus Sumerlaeota bacterium]
MIKYSFDFEKTLQAVALILRREKSREMNYMRLIKLLYLADRKSIEETGEPITGDRVFAMQRGPVLSELLNLVKGTSYRSPDWDQYIQKDQYNIELKEGKDPGVLALSPYEIETIENILQENINHDEWDMVEITHNLAEWIKNAPGKTGRNEIAVEDILQALGKLDEKEEIEKEIAMRKSMAKIFG